LLIETRDPAVAEIADHAEYDVWYSCRLLSGMGIAPGFMLNMGLTVVKSCSWGGVLPIHLFRHFCCRIYRLSISHDA